MINIKDYRSYMAENHSFLKELEMLGKLTINRIAELFLILEWITNKVESNAPLEGDYELIFDATFAYLYEQLEQIKTVYRVYFNGNMSVFSRYESYLNYYLLVESIMLALKETDQLGMEEMNRIDHILEELDETMQYLQEPSTEKLDLYQTQIDGILEGKDEILTMLEVLSRIYEDLTEE